MIPYSTGFTSLAGLQAPELRYFRMNRVLVCRHHARFVQVSLQTIKALSVITEEGFYLHQKETIQMVSNQIPIRHSQMSVFADVRRASSRSFVRVSANKMLHVLIAFAVTLLAFKHCK